MANRDPYLLLAQQTGFIDYLPARGASSALEFILQLADGGAGKLLARAKADSSVLVNMAHLEAGSRFVTAGMTLEALEKLDAEGAFDQIELAEPLRHQRTLWPKEKTGPGLAAGPIQPAIAATTPTLAAILDDGCPFAHAEFRRPGESRTRVVTLWDMDPQPELPFSGSAPPAGFFRGREVPGRVLDGWIQAHGANGTVDESACYHAARYSAVEVELTHGSHLLGRLAGAGYSRVGPGRDEGAKADIAFVQLPRRAMEAPDAGSVHACILDALRYLRGFAERSGYERCVFTCAKGSMLGPHDGTSLFERALDAFLAETGVSFQVVFAAGNAYEHKVHAVLSPQPGQSAAVAWMLPGENEVATFAELWLGPEYEQVTISVQPQNQPVTLGDGTVTELTQWLTALRTGRQVTLRAAPTRVSDGVTPEAKPGRVSIIADSDVPTKIHGYLCWGGRNLGYARETQQARWRIPAGGGNCEVPGSGTLLGDGCGASPALHVVGGYVGAPEPARFERARYSAAGPSRGTRPGPDFLALSEEDPGTYGIPGPGTRTSITRRVGGTSVAAPQAARALINGEPLPRNGSPLPPNPELGGGFLP